MEAPSSGIVHFVQKVDNSQTKKAKPWVVGVLSVGEAEDYVSQYNYIMPL